MQATARHAQWYAAQLQRDQDKPCRAKFLAPADDSMLSDMKGLSCGREVSALTALRL